MTTAVLFVVFLLVVAGLVAAAGDRMGHLAARRKIRFGKMRPRNVSTIIAVVTGLLISLVTFLILFALWENFRDALLRHGQVRANLAQAEQQLAQAGEDLRVAQEQTQQAVDEKAQAELELSSLQDDVSALRGQVAEAAMELDQKNQLIEQRGKEISQLNAKKSKLEKDIEGYGETVVPDLRKLASLTGAELDAYKHEPIMVTRGTRLFYLELKPTEHGQLKSRLAAALVRLSDRLSNDGLSLDEGSTAAMEAFVNDYPYRQAEFGAAVVISADTNVIKNGKVLLAFQAVPLTPLVKAGDEVLTATVEKQKAKIGWLGSEVATLDVPAQFDKESYADFVEVLWGVFMDQAAATGFLPDLVTGEIANPLDGLATIYDDLTTRERPFVIKVVATASANALQGLGSCDINVSQLSPEGK